MPLRHEPQGVVSTRPAHPLLERFPMAWNLKNRHSPQQPTPTNRTRQVAERFDAPKHARTLMATKNQSYLVFDQFSFLGYLTKVPFDFLIEPQTM